MVVARREGRAAGRACGAIPGHEVTGLFEGALALYVVECGGRASGEAINCSGATRGRGEMADARVLEARGEILGGSSPSARTTRNLTLRAASR